MDFVHYLDTTLDLIEGLVNSHRADGTHERLDGPGDLERFLRSYGVAPERSPTRRDLADVNRLAARLRAIFEAQSADRAAAMLNGLLGDGGARPKLVEADDGSWALEYVPPRTELGRRLAVEAAMALAHVVSREGFERLRVCEWETCSDVFVDRSKNRSRRFCSPDVCGNRASVAAWRARRARSPASRKR